MTGDSFFVLRIIGKGMGMTNEELIKRIQDALGTAETGEALIEIIRSRNENAKELASMYNFGPEMEG